MLWMNSNEAYAHINYNICDNYSWKLDIPFVCHEGKKFGKQGRLDLPKKWMKFGKQRRLDLAQKVVEARN
jgi:hypothetical protein